MVDSDIRMDFSPNTALARPDGAGMVPRYTLYGDSLDRPNWFANVEPMERRCEEQGWVIKPHTHPRMTQLAFCVSGGGHITIEGERIAFGPGSAMVIPPHCIHGFNYNGQSTGWVVTIETLYLEDLLRRAPELKRVVRQPGVLAFSDQGFAQIERTIEHLEGELGGTGRDSSIGAEIQLLSMLLLLLRLWPAEDEPPPVMGGRAELVQRFRELVERSYREQPLLPEVAKALGVSASQLRLACTTIVGIPPIEIMHDRLLVEAKRCLSYTPMSVGEIAVWLGFSDGAYFSRFFSKTAGISPSAFRRLHAPGFT